MSVDLYSNLLLGLSIMDARIWWSVPLVAVISLVYGATRHENVREIVVHAWKSAVWVVSFMALIFIVIWFSGYWN